MYVHVAENDRAARRHSEPAVGWLRNPSFLLLFLLLLLTSHHFSLPLLTYHHTIRVGVYIYIYI